jgi:transposase
MECVLDVYKLPYDKDIPVVCMDESPKQLIEEKRTSIPMKRGREKRVDYEYIRHGVANVFMVNEPLTGKRYIEIKQTKKRRDWAKFAKRIVDDFFPKAKKIRLVMDNYTTHGAAALYETFSPAEAKRIWDRLEFIFTPKHGSWLNMAEIELHVLNGQCLNRHLSSIQKVKTEVEAWQNSRNNSNKKINWQFTTADARIKLKKLYPSLDR